MSKQVLSDKSIHKNEVIKAKSDMADTAKNNERSQISIDGMTLPEVLVLVKDRRQGEALMARLPLQAQVDLALAMTPEDRAGLIYMAPDTKAIVQALPEIELYKTVKTVGKWETQELVEVATEEQINFMLDHDCWNGEKLDSRNFSDWLKLFMTSDDDQVFRLLTAISADTLALAMKKHVRFDSDIMIDDTYYCDPDWVTASNASMREFLERLYALDPNLWIRLLGWVRTHSKPTIEADAIEGHESRMRGKGFPAHSLAITIYYPIELDVRAIIDDWHAQFISDRDSSGAGAMPKFFERETLFIERIMERLINDPENAVRRRGKVETELLDVANKVMIADQVDIADIRRQREALDKVKRWTNIGLELLSGGNQEEAMKLIAEQTMEYFFRAGSMLIDALSGEVIGLERSDRRLGGILASGEFGGSLYPLLEPEPHIPSNAATSEGRAIATLDGYRYAWKITWSFQALIADSERKDHE